MGVLEQLSCKGKTVVVAGGAGAVGRGLSRGLAQAGAHVVIGSRSLQRCQEAASELAHEGSLEGVRLDAGDPRSVEDVVEGVVRDHGRLDALVACQDVNFNWPNEELTPEQWDGLMDVSLKGSFLLSRQAAEVMRRDGRGGSIVLIGSIFGIRGPDVRVHNAEHGAPVHAGYWATKGGMASMTRFLAAYYAADGIRVNTLSPGGIQAEENTPDADVPVAKHDFKSDFVAAFEEHVPLRRLGRPGDLAGPITFLVSDASSYVTGHDLVVDGGYTVI